MSKYENFLLECEKSMNRFEVTRKEIEAKSLEVERDAEIIRSKIESTRKIMREKELLFERIKNGGFVSIEEWNAVENKLRAC